MKKIEVVTHLVFQQEDKKERKNAIIQILLKELIKGGNFEWKK